MNLDDVYRINLPRKRRKRIGCGIGSGHGKTSCRGTRGATTRSGWGGKGMYEGGQTPIKLRMPRKGFVNGRFKATFSVVNVDRLNVFADGETVDRKALIAKGLLSAQDHRVKVLGHGTLERKLRVVADHFSEAAKAQISGRGGEAKLIKGKPSSHARRKGKPSGG